MITLKENQLNTLTFQKEDDTPFADFTPTSGSVFNVIMTETLTQDTGSSKIVIGTWTNPTNPRWVTLQFTITGSDEYVAGYANALPGTTYDLAIYYGPEAVSSPKWGEASTTWVTTDLLWNQSVSVPTVIATNQLEYEDRVFISGSVSPITKEYVSDNENGYYTVYQG